MAVARKATVAKYSRLLKLLEIVLVKDIVLLYGPFPVLFLISFLTRFPGSVREKEPNIRSQYHITSLRSQGVSDLRRLSARWRWREWPQLQNVRDCYV